MFSDPHAFLKTLQDIAPKVAQHRDELISKTDLVWYSQSNPNDPRGEAAAKIAADHFDELTKLAAVPTVMNTVDKHSLNGQPAIGTWSVDEIANLYDGKLSIASSEAATLGFAAFNAACSIAFAAIAADTTEIPMLAVASGTAALYWGKQSLESGYAAWQYPSRIKALAATDKATLDSWSEINHRQES